jgi:hypothetical protein
MVSTLQRAALGNSVLPCGACSYLLLWCFICGCIQPLEDCDGSIVQESNRVDIVKEKLDSRMRKVVNSETKCWNRPVWAWGWSRG